ncbi:MAG: hypothetical protein ACJAX5_002962 [Patiriisocius sp.]|jgi:hypothetical protein
MGVTYPTDTRLSVVVGYANPFSKTQTHDDAKRPVPCPLFAVAVDSITFDDEGDVSTYRSSEWVERGFCKQCGSSLFYRLKETNHAVVFLLIILA